MNNNGIITAYEYDANGNLLSETTGSNISTFTYDNANRMTGLVNFYGETPRETETYTYYPNGNKKSVTDTAGKLTQYTYDNAGRLTAETVDGVATSYTYDGYNNRIEKTENGAQTSYLYDSRNRLTKETTAKNGQTAVTSYQYDQNGNLYSRQTLTFAEDNAQRPKVSVVLMGYTAETNDMLLEYNNLNQLTTVTKGDEIVTYDYYANGMRKSKSVDGVISTYYWDGQNMVGEVFVDSLYTYLWGHRLIASPAGENTLYYHFNGHGDVTTITDMYGITNDYQYDAFGNVKNPYDLDYQPFRYCGEYFDQETGFIYLRARYYDPSMGRFISEDPARDGMNWYAYCGNNPVMFVDPTGYIREPGYNAKGEWSENPDFDDYGHIPYVYESLVVLGNNWNNATEKQRENIEALAAFVRTVGDDPKAELRISIYGEELDKKPISSTEKVVAIANPLGALAVHEAQKTAWAEVISRYGMDNNGDLDGSNANAFLHCYWNALITKAIGADWARLFTDSHEYGIEGNIGVDAQMDLFNNDVGINLGVYNQNESNWYIAGEVQKYVDNGWLLRNKVSGVKQETNIVTNGNYR